MKCTRRGCDATATHTLQPPYGNPWYGCEVHYVGMVEALKFGAGAAGNVEVFDIVPDGVVG